MASSNDMNFCRENIEFTVKGPIALYCDEERKALSGGAVIDITLAKPSRVGEIVFRNFYVAAVNVLIQTEKDAQTSPPNGRIRPQNPWKVSIQRKVLMPVAHEEEGSHDVFSIVATESAVPWEKVTMMRIILRQPSPLWAAFRLEELNLYADLPRLGAPHPTQDMQKFLEVIRRHTTKALTAIGPASHTNELHRSASDSSKPLESTAIPTPVPYEIHKLPIS